MRRPALSPPLCWLAAAILLLSACNEPLPYQGSGGSVDYGISIVSGNGQSGALNSELSAPLRVFVTNNNGVKQPSVRVDFRIVEGYGELSSPSAVTDIDGYAEVKLTPTYAPGEVKVEASPAGDDSKVTFTCEARQG